MYNLISVACHDSIPRLTTWYNLSLILTLIADGLYDSGALLDDEMTPMMVWGTRKETANV